MQKSLRYQHHKENYLLSVENGIIPSGLKINKKPAFLPISDDFTDKWNNILFNAEEKLVRLLLLESDKVINNLQEKIEEMLYEKYGNDIENCFKELEQKHADYKNKLKLKRQKKWDKFKNAEVTSSNIEVIDIPNNFITDNRLWRKKVQKINETITNEKPPEETNISRTEKTCDRVSYADIVRENKPSKHHIDFRGIYLNLLQGEGSNDSKVEISPPSICTNLLLSIN